MLKAILTADEFNALAGDLKSHYSKRDDGSYYLSVEGVNGWKLENTEALNRALERERENVKTEKATRQALEANLEGIDLAEAKSLIAKKKSGKPDNDQQAAIDAAVKAVTDKLNLQTEEVKKTLARRELQLQKEMVKSRVESDILAEEGNAVLLLPHVAQYCKLVENTTTGEYELRVVDASGQNRMSMMPDNNGPMGVREFIKSLKKDPTYQVGFKGTGATGSGRTPAGPNSGGSGKKLSADPKSADYNMTELSKLKNEDPTAYKQLMDEYAAASR